VIESSSTTLMFVVEKPAEELSRVRYMLRGWPFVWHPPANPVKNCWTERPDCVCRCADSQQ
jgi:hypothetical protein